MRIALRAFGVEVSEPTIVMCDNRSVVSNNVIAESTLKKGHVGIAYHMCREAVASYIICVHHLLSRHNRADILTKSFASPVLHEHNSNIFRIIRLFAYPPCLSLVAPQTQKTKPTSLFLLLQVPRMEPRIRLQKRGKTVQRCRLQRRGPKTKTLKTDRYPPSSVTTGSIRSSPPTRE